MEDVGVGVDVAELQPLERPPHGRVRAARPPSLRRPPGEEFNVNSHARSSARSCSTELGLPPQKKTKTGYSTDAASLEKLRGQHPIIEHLLRTARSRSCARPTARVCWPRWRPTGASTPRSTRRSPAPAGSASDQPNLHNIPVRSEVGRAFRKAFVPAPGCELLVADYNQIELRCIAHLAEDPGLIAAFDVGPGHPHRHRGAGVRRRARRRSRSSSGRRRRWSPTASPTAWRRTASASGSNIPTEEAAGDPRRVLRGLPEREGLHGAHRRRGPRARATPRRCSAGAGRSPSCQSSQLPHPPGGRAPGDERRHPGPRRRHLQGRARAPRRRARAERTSTSRLDPPGARRGAARGARRHEASDDASAPTRSDRHHAATHAELRRAARGQPRRWGTSLGRRARSAAPFDASDVGATRRSERDCSASAVRRSRSDAGRDHWFEPLADHLGAAYLRYSFTKGTEQEVDFLVDALGLEPGTRVLDVGCGPGRHAHALARRGHRGRRRRHLASASSTSPRRDAPAGAHVRAARRPGPARSTREFDAAISLCQGAFGLAAGAGATTTATVLGGHGPGRCGPAGRLARQRVLRVLPGAVPRGRRHVRCRRTGVHHERTEVQGRGGRATRRSSCGPPASRRVSCGCWSPAAGLDVERLWSVEPGRYAATPPDLEHAEFLVRRADGR